MIRYLCSVEKPDAHHEPARELRFVRVPERTPNLHCFFTTATLVFRDFPKERDIKFRSLGVQLPKRVVTIRYLTSVTIRFGDQLVYYEPS